MFLLYACHPRSGSPPPCCTICCYYFTGGSTNVRDSQHSPPVPPHDPPPPAPHHPAHPIYPVHPVFTRSSRSTRSTRSTSVLLTENCLLPANNGSTGITRGSPLFIMLDDLVRRLRGLKIRNRLKHFSLRRNSLLSSLPFVPFVLYAAFVSKNGWREGNRWSISTNEIRWKFNIDRKEFFLYEGIHFLLPFFFLFCIRFFVGRRKEIIIHTAMKIQNWLKNFFYFHSLSYFFSVSLDEERKSRTNHSMICLSSFVIEQIRTSFTLCWKFKIDQKIFFTKEFSFFISVLLYSIGRRKEIIHNLLFFLPSYVWHVERNEIERITILRWKFKIDRKIFFTFTFFRSVAWRKENRERIILHNLPFSLRSYIFITIPPIKI